MPAGGVRRGGDSEGRFPAGADGRRRGAGAGAGRAGAARGAVRARIDSRNRYYAIRHVQRSALDGRQSARGAGDGGRTATLSGARQEFGDDKDARYWVENAAERLTHRANGSSTGEAARCPTSPCREKT